MSDFRCFRGEFWILAILWRVGCVTGPVLLVPDKAGSLCLSDLLVTRAGDRRSRWVATALTRCFELIFWPVRVPFAKKEAV